MPRTHQIRAELRRTREAVDEILEALENYAVLSRSSCPACFGEEVCEDHCPVRRAKASRNTGFNLFDKTPPRANNSVFPQLGERPREVLGIHDGEL